jgi:hypothetical protein
MIESFITIHNRNPNLKKCHIELDIRKINGHVDIELCSRYILVVSGIGGGNWSNCRNQRQ